MTTVWKECDNCPNQIPAPRALCPICEVNPDRQASGSLGPDVGTGEKP